jgi:ClpP class serine protease
MDIHPIAKVMAEKGVESVDMSMFNEDQRREIYSQAADTLIRLNRIEQAFIAMERAGRPLPIEKLKKVAENKIMLGQYQEAYDLLLKTGQNEMAEFVKANFL